MEMDARWRRLSELNDLEDFDGYAIDVKGRLWSLKYKLPKLRKPVWSGKGNVAYLSCKVRDNNGKAKTLYIHRLVAEAFLPCDDPTRRVKHKNEDRTDNSLENLEWVTNKQNKQETLNFVLHETLVQRILQVHIAAQMKGLKVGDSYEFTTKMVETAVDGYISQYGLRKVMPTL